MIRCAIYTRQSIGSEDELSSCQIQFEACEAFVRSQRLQGWILLQERFDDNGYSGATCDRPALERLVTLIRMRAVDRVVIHRLDRLSRSLLGCAKLLNEFRDQGIVLVIVTAPELGQTAQDSFMLNILASFAQFERELIASRIAESRAILKARGLRIAGAVPFGYEADPRTKQLTSIANEAAVVKWMFEQAAAAMTPAGIADSANARGWRTKELTQRRTGKRRGGNLWTARQVIATLRNPVYLGMFRDKNDFRIGHHEAIVTHELFAAVAAQLESPSNTNTRQTLQNRLAIERTDHVCGLQQANVAPYHPISEFSLPILPVPLNRGRAAALWASGFRTCPRVCIAAEYGGAMAYAFEHEIAT